MSNKYDARNRLAALLKEIYDNEDFIVGTILFSGTVDNWNTIADFIEYAYEVGDQVTHDDIVGLAHILGEKAGVM